MRAIVIMVLLMVNFPAYVAIGWLVFGSLDEFGNAFEYSWRGEFWSWWDGQGPGYEWARVRFGVFCGASVLLVAGEYKLVMFVIEKLTGA
jgi:hypothetical protein